jgi:multicomponent Na+:H+ antiporter subunit D
MTALALAAVVLLPLVGAAAAIASARVAAAAGLVTAAGVVAACTVLVLDLVAGRTLLLASGGWAAPFGIELRADGLSVLMLCIAAAVGLCISIYATAYYADIDEDADRGVRFFWPLWLLCWAAINAVFLSGDLFNLYVCLELLSISAVALVALDSTRAAVSAALRYLLVSLAGSLAYLLGVALAYSGGGTLSLALLPPEFADAGAGRLALALMSVGLFAKAALVPLHFWLPPAHAAAPAPASAVLSGLVVKAAFYIVLRLWTGPFAGALLTHGATVLGVLGAVAVVWGSALALRQRRVKLIIACSTVAQLGYLFLLFPLLAAAPEGAWSGGMYHLLSHALAKAALFLCAGSMIRALGSDDLHRLAGVGQKMPVTFATFGIAGLNLAGMPPSGGFIGKWLLLSAALSAGQWWWAAVLALGSLMAAAYVLLVLRAAFVQPTAQPLRQQPPARMTAAALALALLALGLGVWADGPLTILHAARPGALP